MAHNNNSSNNNNNNLSMNTKTLMILACILVLPWHLPSSCVRGIGGAMGPVVSLVHPTYGTLMAICALQARTFLPTCWGTLPEGKPTPTTQPMWALTAGHDFVCGLRYKEHTPICWGANNVIYSIPSAYANTSYSNINAGELHVCGVRDNNSLTPGIVDCWGDNSSQQTKPPNVTMLSVTSGLYYSCGIIQASRKVVCWGDMGSRSMYMSSPPSDGQFKAIFSTVSTMCGIKLDGLTECWGPFIEIDPSRNNPYPNRLYSSLLGTMDDTCAVDQLTHQVMCWSKAYGARMPNLFPYSYLSASEAVIRIKNTNENGIYDYICGVREDKEVGNLYCWGTWEHSFTSSLSSFIASKGVCMEECPSLSTLDSDSQNNTPSSSSVLKIVLPLCMVVVGIFLF